MKKIKYLCGAYLLLLLVGISSNVIPVIYSMISYCTQKEENSNITDILASIALLFGGLLCVLVAKNQYGVKISKNIKKYLLKCWGLQ